MKDEHRKPKKINQKADFTKVTDEEAMKEYLDHSTREAVQEGYQMAYLYLQLRFNESELEFKREQLDKGPIQERYNGALKPKNMMVAEHDMVLQNYKRTIIEYEKLKDKFKTVHKFSKEDIVKIVRSEFSFPEWEKNKVKQIEEEKDEVEVKAETDKTAKNS